MATMFAIRIVLVLLAAPSPALAAPGLRELQGSRLGLKASWARKSHKTTYVEKRASTSASCTPDAKISITAPQPNIFGYLSDQEAADVTAFLHTQKSLNLTNATTAGAWDNVLNVVELLQPNKTAALPYIDDTTAKVSAPTRYAKATVQFGATLNPYLQEFMVGPLPVAKGTTTLRPLNYIYNKGEGVQRVYNQDAVALAEFNYKIGSEVADMTLDLLNGTSTGAANDTLLIGTNDPLIHENGRIVGWNQFYALQTGIFADETALPSGFQFKTDITGRDPSKWTVTGWFYNGNYYKTLQEFRAAWKSYGFKKPGPNADGDWLSTDQYGPVMPHDDLYPPVPVSPQGNRFALDTEQNYVEWMDFSFYIGFSRDTGISLHNVKLKGERIIYELGLQEALAHYASATPLESHTAYLDSLYGLGPSAFTLVQGFDCPAYATYLNTSFYQKETTHTHMNSMCLFEFDHGHPVQRHVAAGYVSVTKDIALILRSVSTVGNYDYMFEYMFHVDGSIHVTVRASGYIQAAFWVNDPQYGYHIHDNLSGALHDHILNYKLDLDVKGTANSLMSTQVVPTVATFPWSPNPLNTMKLERSFISNENEGAINWDENAATMYMVVNRDTPNKYGEYPGFKVMPASYSTARTSVQFPSTNLGRCANWMYKHLWVTRQHDTELRSAYPYNSYEPDDPVIDFSKFLNGESLDQEDLVLYFNLGMHHIPDTSDLPNTVFSTAQSSLVITPMNYFDTDLSRQTVHMVRVDFNDSAVSQVDTFGTVLPTCAYDMAAVGGDQSTFVGELILPKYPLNYSAIYETGPGGS